MTAYASLNGNVATSMDLTIPYYGTWSADVMLAQPATLSGSILTVLSDLQMMGAVYRTDQFAGLQSARIEGGAGGWQKVIPSHEYHSPAGVMASMVVRDAANLVGERVSVVQDTNIGPFYLRESGPASSVLRALFGTLWWIDSTGVTQCGTPRATSMITSAFVLLDFHPDTGRMEVSTEFPSDWMPGRKVQTNVLTTLKTLSFVRHKLTNDGTLVTEALAS